MALRTAIAERRTSADDVFDYLHNEIVSLKIMPGTKMSEVEIARRFDISRQPVREAFIRLANLGLLLIRPQKATIVRKFSRESIANARFVRTAVEIEILRKACAVSGGKELPLIEKNLDQQDKAISENETKRFHALDYEFHKMLADAAECAFAFQTIVENKAQVDRLCMLSLANDDEMAGLLEDHLEIYGALKRSDEDAMVAAIRRHLGRLDGTVEAIYAANRAIFED